jgi:hypothetical protein
MRSLAFWGVVLYFSILFSFFLSLSLSLSLSVDSFAKHIHRSKMQAGSISAECVFVSFLSARFRYIRREKKKRESKPFFRGHNRCIGLRTTTMKGKQYYSKLCGVHENKKKSKSSLNVLRNWLMYIHIATKRKKKKVFTLLFFFVYINRKQNFLFWLMKFSKCFNSRQMFYFFQMSF